MITDHSPRLWVNWLANILPSVDSAMKELRAYDVYDISDSTDEDAICSENPRVLLQDQIGSENIRLCKKKINKKVLDGTIARLTLTLLFACFLVCLSWKRQQNMKY